MQEPENPKSKKEAGFRSCGRWYSMGEPQKPYIETLKDLIKQIQETSIRNKRK